MENIKPIKRPKSKVKDYDLEVKRKKENERKLKKAMTPGECMKYMIIKIDSKLLEIPEGSEIISKLLSLDLQYTVVQHDLPYMVSYARKNCLTNEETDESEKILIMPVDDFISKIYFQIYGDRSDMKGTSLYNFCTQHFSISPRPVINIVVCGLDEYLKKRDKYKKSKSVKNVDNLTSKGKPRKPKSTNCNYLLEVTRIDVETALIFVQFELEITVRLISNPSKVGDFICQIAKAVAQKPFKLSKMDMVISSKGKKKVKVDLSNENFLSLWREQLMEFPNVSSEIVDAISNEYPSPRALFNAYKGLSSEEGAKLLENIRVRRGVGVLETSRRVGGELSKKIYKFFTESDPDALL